MTGVFLFPPLAEPCEKEGWLLRTIYHYFDKLLGYVTYTAAAVSGLAILLTAFMICYEIIARSVFGSPTVWVMEISTYFLIFAGFLGMAYTMRKNGHICVDFLYARFSRNVRRVLDIFTSSLSLFAMYVCVTESTNYMLMSYDMGIVSPSLLRVPLWIPQTAMVVGFTLLFLEILNHLLRDFFDDGKEEKL